MHGNLGFTIGEGYFFLLARDRHHFERERQYEIWQNVLGTCLPEIRTALCLDDMKKIAVTYFSPKKSNLRLMMSHNLYSFKRKTHDLSDVPLVYENRSFAIIGFREKPCGAWQENAKASKGS